MTTKSLASSTIVVLLLLAACGSSGSTNEAISEADADQTTAVPTANPNDDAPIEPDEVELDDSGSEAATPTATATPDLGLLDPNNVEPGGRLLTPVAGGGQHPLLEWEPVEGATSYSVAVYDAEGWPYWGTLVDVTQTYVGGPIQLKDDKPGPRISDGMSWSITALDEELHVVAISGRRPIGP